MFYGHRSGVTYRMLVNIHFKKWSKVTVRDYDESIYTKFTRGWEWDKEFKILSGLVYVRGLKLWPDFSPRQNWTPSHFESDLRSEVFRNKLSLILCDKWYQVYYVWRDLIQSLPNPSMFILHSAVFLYNTRWRSIRHLDLKNFALKLPWW